MMISYGLSFMKASALSNSGATVGLSNRVFRTAGQASSGTPSESRGSFRVPIRGLLEHVSSSQQSLFFEWWSLQLQPDR